MKKNTTTALATTGAAALSVMAVLAAPAAWAQERQTIETQVPGITPSQLIMLIMASSLFATMFGILALVTAYMLGRRDALRKIEQNAHNEQVRKRNRARGVTGGSTAMEYNRLTGEITDERVVGSTKDASDPKNASDPGDTHNTRD